MNIVFVGSAESREAIRHVDGLREKGHNVWVAPMRYIDYEGTAQKICNADEIHVWLTDGFTGSAASFYLGMAHMFTWANVGQNLSFEIKLLNTENLGSEGILGQLVR